MDSFHIHPLARTVADETTPLRPDGSVNILLKPETVSRASISRAESISYNRGFNRSNQLYKSIPDGFKLELFELVQDLHKDEFRGLIDPYVHITEEGERLIDLRDHDDRSLLSVAAYKGNHFNVEIVLELYRKLGVSPYSEDKNGNNALELACIRGYNSYSGALAESNRTKRYEVIARLMGINHGPKSLIKDAPSQTDFSIATKTLQGRRSINRGNTPLHWAAYWKDKDIFKLMIDINVEQVFMRNDNSELPFDIFLKDMNQFYDLSDIRQHVSPACFHLA
jgi:ankyrin repeat protein